MQEDLKVMNPKDLQMIKELRLMDDDFFSEALDGKIEAVEYILNTILERDDVKVKSAKSQVEYKSAMILSILVYTFFSRMFDLMLPPVAKHSIVVA